MMLSWHLISSDYSSCVSQIYISVHNFITFRISSSLHFILSCLCTFIESQSLLTSILHIKRHIETFLHYFHNTQAVKTELNYWYDFYLLLIFLKLISCEISTFCKLNIEILYLKWENQNLDLKIATSVIFHNCKNVTTMTEFKNKNSWLRKWNVNEIWYINLSDYCWEIEDSSKSQ